jgi:hypothetical protein
MTGTFEDEEQTSTGVTLFRFSDIGTIVESCVYRQAAPAEIVLAQRSKCVQPVQQAVLLESSRDASAHADYT